MKSNIAFEASSFGSNSNCEKMNRVRLELNKKQDGECNRNGLPGEHLPSCLDRAKRMLNMLLRLVPNGSVSACQRS